MADLEAGVLAIGAGPANLALAVAIEESGSTELAEHTLMLEQAPDVKWQRDLLMPWARSQVSFLKDLVTLRNPRSRFSFLNFLHANGRLDEFINLGTFHPYRLGVLRLPAVGRRLAGAGADPLRRQAPSRRTRPVTTDGRLTGWQVTAGRRRHHPLPGPGDRRRPGRARPEQSSPACPPTG